MNIDTNYSATLEVLISETAHEKGTLLGNLDLLKQLVNELGGSFIAMRLK